MGSYRTKRKVQLSFIADLIEVFCKYANLDPLSREGQALVGHHFICQSAADIQHTLQELQKGLQMCMIQLLDLAFSEFNNQDPHEGEKRRARVIAVTIGNALSTFKLSKGKSRANQGLQEDWTPGT